jgi:hypothetical protein
VSTIASTLPLSLEDGVDSAGGVALATPPDGRKGDLARLSAAAQALLEMLANDARDRHTPAPGFSLDSCAKFVRQADC